ncbi:SAM-dependent methyltransferase, partial [Acidisphaera rubrifaciens]|uniref:SAM-dependent methyltransferase n=1 Tax=Acidisphaera rubrifaciens TaxID=50715 RepID=UPI0006629612
MSGTHPERLDHYMARANAAYYAARDPFADFTTAPEISQVFGEICGLWAAVVWQSMGAPPGVVLAEAGPGRGTLMADALRAIRRQVPAFAAALRLVLAETSPRLRARQAAVLPEAVWVDAVEDLPPGPLILIANEFLDALPVRQFERTARGWAERHVADGAFVLRPAPAPDHPAAATAAVGAVIEVGEAARG